MSEIGSVAYTRAIIQLIEIIKNKSVEKITNTIEQESKIEIVMKIGLTLKRSIK